MKQKGFTLLEMAIVLGILGVLTAFIAPPLYTYFTEVKGRSIAQTVRTLEIALGSFWTQQGAWPLDNDPELTVFCGNEAEGDPDLLGDFRILWEGDDSNNNDVDYGLFYNKQGKQYIREKDLPVKSVSGDIILYLVEDIVVTTAEKRDDIAIVFTVCPDSKGHQDIFRKFDEEYDKKPDWRGAKAVLSKISMLPTMMIGTDRSPSSSSQTS